VRFSLVVETERVMEFRDVKMGGGIDLRRIRQQTIQVQLHPLDGFQQRQIGITTTQG